VRAHFRETLKGKLWAIKAITDAVQGTVDNQPPPIDLDALFRKGLSVEETLRRIQKAYSRRG
jgi:hypothetical protein